MIKLDTHAGLMIQPVIENAKRIATEKNDTVELEFNGLKVLVNADTDVELLLRDYDTSWVLDWNTIGPNPVIEYDAETLNAIQEALRDREEKQALQQAEWDRQDEEQKGLFNEKVDKTDILLKDAKTWDEYVEKNQDPYGKCAVDYACDWARLMQYYIAKGESIEQCSNRASHELRWYGITGFMYGYAVQMLSQCWKHGEELRKWHNKEYNHEGHGVVNPAILTINPK